VSLCDESARGSVVDIQAGFDGFFRLCAVAMLSSLRKMAQLNELSSPARDTSSFPSGGCLCVMSEFAGAPPSTMTSQNAITRRPAKFPNRVNYKVIISDTPTPSTSHANNAFNEPRVTENPAAACQPAPPGLLTLNSLL
jgi:hypothetical protein